MREHLSLVQIKGDLVVQAAVANTRRHVGNLDSRYVS